MLKVTLFALAVIASASGQIHDLGQCPDVDLVKLDLDKYLGRWYEMARIENKDEKNLRCITFDILPRSNKTIYHEIPIIQTGYDKKNLSYTRQTSADDFGLLDAVEVDYENYAVVYDCDANLPGPPWIFPSFRTRFAWILSRKPELDSEIVETLANKLVSLGIPGGRILYTDNKNCPLR